MTHAQTSAMLLFVAGYSVTYGILNLYVLRWLKPAFGWKRKGTLLFCLFILMEIFMPVAGRLLEHSDHSTLSRFPALAGYCWMPLLLWFISFGLVADAWNALTSLSGRRYPRTASFKLQARTVVGIIVVISLGLSIRGLYEVEHIRLETIDIPAAGPRQAGSAPLRLLQVSDVHLNPMTTDAHLGKLLSVMKNAQADVIVFTGDIYDSPASCMNSFTSSFARLNVPLGKYAVLGNHEYFTGLQRSLELLGGSGFRVLREDYLTVKKGKSDFVIAGVDDLAARVMKYECFFDEARVLSRDKHRPFTILLKHHPFVRDDTSDFFDLQLSGHTHGGQIFPFNWVEKLVFRYTSGFYPAAKLYVSPGAGTWGPPLRVFAPPTVTLFVIYR